VQPVTAGASVVEEALQCQFHRAKGEVVPGNLVLRKQARFLGFRAWIEAVVQQIRQVEQVHLADLHHVEQGEQVPQFDARTGFFVRLAKRALSRGFSEFQEARGQGPEPQPRLDVAAAQQHLALPNRHGPHHIERVFVLDVAASATHGPLPVVVRRNAVFHAGAAGTAVHDPRTLAQQHVHQCSPAIV